MASITPMFITVTLLLMLHATEAKIGVCYGRKGNNLPCAREVVDLYESYGISAMRLYDPDQATLEAVKRTDIKVMLGVANNDIRPIACEQSKANEWVETNVVPYANSIQYIIVGNEIRPHYDEASSMEPAMQNIQKALSSCNLGGYEIKVSTAIDSSLIVNSYPPSTAEFENKAYIIPIIKFLMEHNSPLFANIEVYTAYINDPEHISLDYALFTACGTVFTDKNTGLHYQNLFDALYDAANEATQKIVRRYGTRNDDDLLVELKTGEVSWSSGNFRSLMETRMTTRRGWSHHRNNNGRGECGWPPKGSEPATVENAKTFYTNLIKHVKQGTPMTRGKEIETFLFAMFDENLKWGDESERHYGLFTPNREPKYDIFDFA